MESRSLSQSIVTVAFFATIGLAIVLDRRPDPTPTDAEHPGFAFTEVSEQAGLRFTHQRARLDPKLANVEPHVAAVGAAVSVADVDGDGWVDLYFSTSRFGAANALFRNLGNGRFEDVAASAGVALISRPERGASMGSVWGDYDNDGREDLLVYRYGYLDLYHNLGDLRFEPVTAAAGLDRWINSNGAIWVDYDRDGFLDLYVTAYFRADVNLWDVESTRIMHDSFEFSSNGGANLLFRNRGDGSFEDVTERMGVGSTRWTLAAAAADFDDDGWPDLYLANDYGPEELFLNRQGKGFVLARAGLEATSKSGMAVALGDIYNRGRLDVFVTNISEKGYLFQNNNLRLNLLGEAGRFENLADGPVADAGWAWGSQFGDFNNDGFVDLFVANGFISADPDRSYWYDMSKIAGANRHIFEDAANWPPFGNASLSGYERSRVLLNRRGQGWVDVAEQVGVRDVYDGRAVALADLFNDGSLDVIVANQSQPATLYRTEADPTNHWIAFALQGTASNRSAIGAEVTATFGNAKQRRVIDGGMGFASQNDRRVHFGLGQAGWVERVEVRWPSGRVQTLTFPKIDQLHRLTEPER